MSSVMRDPGLDVQSNPIRRITPFGERRRTSICLELAQRWNPRNPGDGSYEPVWKDSNKLARYVAHPF
jgi:hypothetical protein